MNETTMTGQRINPFFEPYNTPHDTVPFDKIKLEDFEEALQAAAGLAVKRDRIS